MWYQLFFGKKSLHTSGVLYINIWMLMDLTHRTYGQKVTVAKPQKNEHVGSSNLIKGNRKLWGGIFYLLGSSYSGNFKMDQEEGSG